MRDPATPVLGGPDVRPHVMVVGDRVSRIETNERAARITIEKTGKRKARKHRDDCTCVRCDPKGASARSKKGRSRA